MSERKRGSALPLPRFVKPEQLEIGDVIRVAYERDDTGITRTHEGTIYKREYDGSDRILLTREGGTLLVWNPHYRAPRVTLLARAEAPQPVLSIFDGTDIEARIMDGHKMSIRDELSAMQSRGEAS